MTKRQIISISIGCLALASCASQPSITITDESQIRKIAEAIVLKHEKWPEPEKTPAPGYPGVKEFFFTSIVQDKDGRWVVRACKAIANASGGGGCSFLPGTERFLTLSPSGKLIHYKIGWPPIQ